MLLSIVLQTSKIFRQSDMDECQKHNAEWKKPYTKGCIVYNIIHRKCCNKQRKLIYDGKKSE